MYVHGAAPQKGLCLKKGGTVLLSAAKGHRGRIDQSLQLHWRGDVNGAVGNAISYFCCGYLTMLLRTFKYVFVDEHRSVVKTVCCLQSRI